MKKGERQREKREVLQKNYTIDEHLQKASKEIQSLFLKLREKITSLDEDIIEESKAKYIAYKTSTNFVDVVLLHGSLKIFLNVKSGELNDPDGLARDLAKPKPVGHWGNGDYEVKLEKESELETVFALIKQSYDLNK
jgi:predicted transport protein